LGSILAARPNAKGEGTISRKNSRVACLVIPTDEERMIAAHTLKSLRAAASPRLQEGYA
jgi:acetate kinase